MKTLFACIIVIYSACISSANANGMPSGIEIRLASIAAPPYVSMTINNHAVTTQELSRLTQRLSDYSFHQSVRLSFEEHMPAFRVIEVLNILFDSNLHNIDLVSFGKSAIYAQGITLHKDRHPMPVILDRDDAVMENVPDVVETHACDHRVRVSSVSIPRNRHIENHILLYVYLVFWIVSLVPIYWWTRRKQLPIITASASHAVPSLVALVMTYVFLIRGGTTNVQFIIGTDSEVYFWSLWTHLWPILITISATSCIVTSIWTIAAYMRKPWRKWIPITMTALLMSAFALVTVNFNIPIGTDRDSRTIGGTVRR